MADAPSTTTLAGPDDEVVTKALLRYVELPYGAGTAALITLDNGRDHTRPSTFGAGGLASLSAALDEVVARSDLVAVAVTGKPFVFAVGADLTGMGRLRDRSDALAVARTGHAVFRRLGELSIPSFAFVNGAAMGGGLELALHCTYRTVSGNAAALSLPECFIGLVPGWGGTYLVPNLVGAAGAVTLIIENPLSQNRQLRPAQALELGIVDRLFEPADFLEQSLAFAARVVTGAERVERAPVDRSPETWGEAVAAGRALAEERLHGAAPAPLRALDLIEAARTRTRDEGFAAEDEALADLVLSDELRACLYSFDLVQRRAKRPAGVPDAALARPVSKVGVVGAGLMAGQLALLFAQRLKVPVVLTDLDQARVDKGLAGVRGEVDKLLKKRRISPDEANRLKASVTGSTDKAAFADADFVIEAVFEEMKVKQQVFAELEAIVSDTCILATNTSSLSVTEMSEHLDHPERVVGFHFFNPVAQMPLLEIARTPRSDDATVATAFAVAKALKKSAVLVKDSPGFVVNRLLTRFMGEVNAAIDEGTPIEVADHALDPLGLPMSPMMLLQLVGPAVALHVGETLHDAFPDRFGVSRNLARLVASGRTAVYTWGEDGLVVDPEVADLYELGSQPSSAEQVRTRAVDALAQEVRLMLDEGVVTAVQDLDLCMLLGAGWPFHLGGISPYLDRTGASERVTGARFLPPGVASLPA
ncbi:MAG TPA: 3-hydroxyacyl-CoA dehydrogenase NAD-binding domain-containing protein [Actinomycetes bacterium]|nr:3-hydroxyacyl-CoA dehydrogenase NAD-binding domain-containing protein [Actinomycetes bacterium]